MSVPIPLAGASAALGVCVAAGGVAVFPTDTVYGLCCDPLEASAVARLYELKGRPPRKPAALLFTAVDVALAALPELGPRARAALALLLPGPLTLLVPNRARRFPLAGGELLGVRVIAIGLELPRGVLQSSANLAGGPDARRLAEVPSAIREAADLVIDAGALHGVASTVIDLGDYESSGRWRILRAGALSEAAISESFAKLAGA